VALWIVRGYGRIWMSLVSNAGRAKWQTALPHAYLASDI